MVEITRQQKEALDVWLEMILTHHRIQRRLQVSLLQFSLTLPQFEVLFIVNQAGGITQQELAERLLVSKGNVCGIIDRLTESGFMERQQDGQDRRINRLHLTPEGRQVIEQVTPEHHGVLTEMFGVLTESEQSVLRKLLHRVSYGHRVVLASGNLIPPENCHRGS